MPQSGLAAGECEAEQSIGLATVTTHQKAAQLAMDIQLFCFSSLCDGENGPSCCPGRFQVRLGARRVRPWMRSTVQVALKPLCLLTPALDAHSCSANVKKTAARMAIWSCDEAMLDRGGSGEGLRPMRDQIWLLTLPLVAARYRDCMGSSIETIPVGGCGADVQQVKPRFASSPEWCWNLRQPRKGCNPYGKTYLHFLNDAQNRASA